MYNWQKMDDCSREFSKDDICYNPENSHLAIPENQLFCKYCVDGGTKTTFFELPMDQRREEIRRCHCISNLQLHPSAPTTQWFNAPPPEKDSSLFQDPKYYSLIWAWMPHTSSNLLYGIMIIMHLLGGGRI